MTSTLAILAVSAIFFAIGKVRSDLVALCALLCLILSGVLTPQEALSGFSNPVVIMMVGLFVVGGAIFHTGLAKKISGKLMSLAGDNELRLFILLMIVTAVIGAFVSNTGTVALMMPIVVSLAAKSKMNASRLLMPLAFASSMGGMLTLIGTPPNLVIQEALINAGYAPLSFFSFFPVGIICITVGIIVLLPLSKLFASKGKGRKGKRKNGKSLSELVEEYRLNEKLSVYQVTSKSSVRGKTLAELDIQKNYGLVVLEIRNEKSTQHGIIKNVEQKLAGPDTTLRESDIIYLSGSRRQAQIFAEEHRLRRVTKEEVNDASVKSSLAFYDIGIAEILLMPNSRLVNRHLKNSGFRGIYNVNVMGIRRNKEYITANLPEVRLQPNDILLVQGTWANIGRLSDEADNWVVLGQPLEEAAKVEIDYKAPIAGGIMLLMVLMMVVNDIPVAPVTAVMIAGILMVVTGCIRNMEAAYKTINWESIVLIAAMLPMSLALEKTGVSSMISQNMIELLGPLGPYAILAGIYFTTSLLTLFISNTATAVLMAPIAITAATGIGISPYPLLFAVTLGASMCFASPFSTPPNALVMKAGQYTFMDYVKVGLPLQIIIGIVMVFALPLLFPF